MAWLNIALVLPQSEVESCVDLMEAAGALAVSNENAGDLPVLEPLPGTNPLWDRVTVKGLFELDVRVGSVFQSLSKAFGSEIKLDVRFLEAQDWSETWRLHAESFRFGNKLWVVPTDWQALEKHEIAYAGALLRLDPGLAFGTGSHPTTNMCLAWLAKESLSGVSMVDYGCGSGILAVAAILLGAEIVFAVDYDAQALLACRSNAAENGLTDTQLPVLSVAEMHSKIRNGQQMDVVVANILMNPLLELTHELTTLTCSRGRLVLSGILENQIDTIVEAYPSFRFDTPIIQDGWACLAGIKSGG